MMITKVFNYLASPFRRAMGAKGYNFGRDLLSKTSFEMALAVYEHGKQTPPDMFDIGVQIALVEHKAMAEGGTAEAYIDGKLVATCDSYGVWKYHDEK